jgi:hypothetical protein
MTSCHCCQVLDISFNSYKFWCIIIIFFGIPLRQFAIKNISVSVIDCANIEATFPSTFFNFEMMMMMIIIIMHALAQFMQCMFFAKWSFMLFASSAPEVNIGSFSFPGKDQ